MKTIHIVIVMMIALVGATFSSYAANPLPSVKKSNTEIIEQNLLVGLASDNDGLRTSAAYYLGEMKSQKAVLPLMKLLHSPDASEEARINAAISLYKIGDARGMYAVKENSRFDESDKVRRLCDVFYKTHVYEKKVN